MTGILNGLRVVEGSAFVAVPLAGMTLAQMGADVIRFDRLQGGLDAGRWPLVSFNKATTALGIKRLRNYRRKHNRSLDTYTGPLHDENSHGADAFGEYAVNSPLVKSKPKKPDEKPDGYKRRTRQEASWKTV